MAQAASAGSRRRHSVLEVLRTLREPKVALMLGLGFSSGLPFLLTAATLGYWLRDAGTSLKAIGFISWVGLAYSFKFIWAPIVDRVSPPGLGRLGRRRSWLIFTQALLIAGLIAMALIRPEGGLVPLGAAALFVALASATQDTALDALRIEAAEDEEELGLLTGGYQLGYRLAVLASDALILILAQHLSWPIAYGIMAALMLVGVASTLMIREPERADQVLADKRPLWTPRGFVDAVVGPFVEFFRSYGLLALVMLLMITLYRLPEFVMGPMATPFYHDLGLTKDFVGGIRITTGLIGTLCGITAGGVLAAALGRMRGLVVGALLQGLAVASFALLAVLGPDPRLFASVMFFDNFGVGAAGVLLVTYMSGLTSLGYTATQYALLSSSYAWIGKVAKGFSGLIVETLAGHFGQMPAYAIFFIGAGAIGIPSLLLCVFLSFAERPRRQPAAA